MLLCCHFGLRRANHIFANESNHTHTHTHTGKKSLAPSALAGLASKLDFTTVKLRKTGMEQMLGDSNNQAVSTNVMGGTEHNTSHPIMLLQIKGKRERRKEERGGEGRRGIGEGGKWGKEKEKEKRKGEEERGKGRGGGRGRGRRGRKIKRGE